MENFDPAGFIASPRAEMNRQFSGDQEMVAHIMSVADADAEVPVVRRLVEHPRVSFEIRAPTMRDLEEAVQAPATAVICNVNYCALVDADGYNGHFVLVTDATDAGLTVQNPGLPPLADQLVDRGHFERAWAWPDPGATNLLVITK